MKQPQTIISEAITKYKPVKVLLLVSGGHDSITSAHISAELLTYMSIPFEVYHGDTTIGIPATQDYVKMICERYNWKLSIRKPPNRKDWYENLVLKFGFPGPTKLAHQIMYRSLKERALNRFVTYECKSAPLKRENVLLLTGVRNDESKIRMGYTEPIRKDRSKIWASPIFYLSTNDCNRYMELNSIPRNPVKDKMCISGECLCGAFDKKEEFAELMYHYPETAEVIMNLHEKAKLAGHPWPWGVGPTEWRKQEAAKAQTKINFMCVGCDSKNSFKP
jgi:3'-phosphoadenosine 5'-phosphosulfate sulfotransferase (PAPS reductase)/FAD synthetase